MQCLAARQKNQKLEKRNRQRTFWLSMLSVVLAASLIYLYFAIPIKAKWFVIGYAAIELLSGIFSSGDQVAHFAHLGGMLVGLVILLIWKKKGRLY